MEEEGENRERCCTPYFHKFVCHGVSVLMMGSSCGIGSCDKTRLSGMMTNELSSGWSASLVPSQIRADSCWKLCPPLLVVDIEQGA